jgi:diguanylate cyclase (GGDEF)-like protein
MKIPETRSGPTAPSRGARTGAAAPAGPAGRAPPVAGARPAADTASIMGIPTEELTPKVREAILALMGEVDRLRQEVERGLQRISYLEKLADEDTLAPVANRRAFVRELTRYIAFAERYGTPSSLIYFDVNGLKAINDMHGHAAGDAALLQIANALVANVRKSDVVARMGGDEFAVLLSHADEAIAAAKARDIVAKIESAPLEWNGTRIELGLAFGVHTFRGGEDTDAALAAADKAMYARKKGSPAGREPERG